MKKNLYGTGIIIPQYANAENWGDIDTTGFDHMELVSDNGNPAMAFITATEKWLFPITNAFEIVICNDFLRAVTMDIDVEFSSFVQYARLIDACNKNLRERKRKIVFDYSELKARVVEKFKDVKRLAAALNLTTDNLNSKLERNAEFNMNDICVIVTLLEISPLEINRYFFKAVA